jgi:large subunit ribosomal protein L30
MAETKAKKAPAKKAEGKKSSGKTVRVTQTGSPIGRQEYQYRTLLGLGLKKRGAVSELEDTPSVRGMINSVRHLIKVEDAA